MTTILIVSIHVYKGNVSKAPDKTTFQKSLKYVTYTFSFIIPICYMM